MPFYLHEADILPDVAELRSVLIVLCRFCPAASLAVKENKPYFEPFRRLLRTGSYESYIQTLKRRLEHQGIQAAVFDSKLPHQFVACMWTERRRKAFARRASQFDGVVVLGCEAAVQTMRDALSATDCKVIPAMEEEGVMNVVPTVSFSGKLSLKVKGLSPVELGQSKPATTWAPQ
ncbi:MAG: hypothetical protein OER90_16320 [Gemmatimonadota bacterium]|nr:hypothetical protein [Gemmatimonadota bacterium]